jgi:hypothetical protein
LIISKGSQQYWIRYKLKKKIKALFGTELPLLVKTDFISDLAISGQKDHWYLNDDLAASGQINRPIVDKTIDRSLVHETDKKGKGACRGLVP